MIVDNCDIGDLNQFPYNLGLSETVELQKFPFVQKRLYDFSTKRQQRLNWNGSPTRILMMDHDF